MFQSLIIGIRTDSGIKGIKAQNIDYIFLIEWCDDGLFDVYAMELAVHLAN